MIRHIFLWFYCLPIWKAGFLLLLATLVFRVLRETFRNTPYWKAGTASLLLVWVGIMLFSTLLCRTGSGNPYDLILIPFASYRTAFITGNREIYRSNFMNAVLFYPAGLLGCESLPGHWSKRRKTAEITILFGLISFGIEYLQYRLLLGQAETDDVIHNMLGTLLGVLAMQIPRSRDHAR